MNTEILLTITMLVSNREDTIEKCMESLKPLLDTVPSELIVVDTAGNEVCMDIVKRYTSNIVRFQWCNDFAAARNAGLNRAKGQWIMFLDDDEWFEDVTEIRDFFLKGICKEYNGAAYLTRNYHNAEGTEWSDRTARRICRKEKETCFKGKIHEYLWPMRNPIYYMKAYVHHYGYVYKSEKERKEHSWRNIKLLQECHKTMPEDWQVAAQLLQEYLIVQEYYSALEVASEICRSEERYSPNRSGFTAYAEVKKIEIYRNQMLYQDAYEEGKKIEEEERALLVSRGCIANLLAGVCYQLERYKEAVFYIDRFEEYLKIWTEKKEQLIHSDFFGVSDRYMTQEERNRLSLLRLHIYVKQECWDKAQESVINIEWKQITGFLTDTPEDMIQLILHTEYIEEYRIGMETILLSPVLKQTVYSKIEALSQEEKQRVFHSIAEIETNDMYIMKSQILYWLTEENREKSEESLEKWHQRNYSFFLPEVQYWTGLDKLQISLTRWIAEMRIESWIHLTEAIFEKFNEKDCQSVYQVLTRDMEKKDIRYLYITGLWLEKQLLETEIMIKEPEDIWNHLYQIASLWVSCAAMLYRENVFQSELQSALPEKYQFAWLIFQANTVRKDTINFARKVAEAAKAYLKMEQICKYILKCGNEMNK